MNITDLINASFGIPAYTLTEFKREIETKDYLLKRDIDMCPDGRVIRRTIDLQSHSTPHRFDLCFMEYNGQYSMMTDQPFFYYGTDYGLYQLSRERIIVFDSWYDLTRFIRHLPDRA